MKHKDQIIPSIASANPLCIGEEIEKLKGYERLHIDIEDGNFVPNITFGLKVAKAIVSQTSKVLDVHILANHAKHYIDQLKDDNIANIAIHYEAEAYPLECLNMIRKYGMKAGIALNLSTPAEAVWPFLDRIDYVLVMTAEPDGEGQIFRPAMLDKISALKAQLSEEKEIWADGGIGDNELPMVLNCGADKVIMGRAIFL